MIINDRKVKIYSELNSLSVPWEKHNVDVLIDATGVRENVERAHLLIKTRVPKVIITHSPPQNIDYYMILGVNEDQYDYKKHNVISSSICDATAITPLLVELDNKWGIENCFITTLHPWLSYQNLVDGSLKSVSNPGHFWEDYSLGRNSTLSLIPKDTTAGSAIIRVAPQLDRKLDSVSFRVPTSIVSASDMTVQVSEAVNENELHDYLKNISMERSDLYEYQEENLVSIDHVGNPRTTIIDSNRLKVLNKNMVKVIIWYDNEWGYSSRVVDIAKLVCNEVIING
jgi:glyceraldehyde 3-phosphate dehydrogenase